MFRVMRIASLVGSQPRLACRSPLTRMHQITGICTSPFDVSQLDRTTASMASLLASLLRTIHIGTAATANSTTTAATRVFAIPELLEQILIEIGLSQHSPPFCNKFTPATTLFLLQRTNSTFQSVIQKSKMLRSIMLLEHNNDTPVLSYDLRNEFGPVSWLFNSPMFAHCVYSFDDIFGQFILWFSARRTSDYSWWQDLVFWEPSVKHPWAHPNATWRKTKLARSPDTSWQAKLTILQNGPEYHYRPHAHYVSLDTRRTLGDLYDYVEALMKHDKRDFSRLSHLYHEHRKDFDLGRTDVLCPSEPSMIDSALLSYERQLSAAMAERSSDWEAETWKCEDLGDRWKERLILESCALCKSKSR